MVLLAINEYCSKNILYIQIRQDTPKSVKVKQGHKHTHIKGAGGGPAFPVYVTHGGRTKKPNLNCGKCSLEPVLPGKPITLGGNLFLSHTLHSAYRNNGGYYLQ